MANANRTEAGQVFRWIRERDGRKQVEVAKAANITPAYLSMIESGTRTPTPAVVKRLAKVYGCPRAFLDGLMPQINDGAALEDTANRGAA